MIDLKDALITDGLPEHLAVSPRMQALAYTVNKQVKRILDYSDHARVYSGLLDGCSEKALDILALELKIPQYKDSFPVEIKRKMVAHGFVYWCYMGTASAVENLCKDMLGNRTNVLEWFDYNGNPGLFKVETWTWQLTQEDVKNLYNGIEKVKRLAAHLEEIIVWFPDLDINITHLLDGDNEQDIRLDGDEEAQVKYSDIMHITYPLGSYNEQDIETKAKEEAKVNYSDIMHITYPLGSYNEQDIETKAKEKAQVKYSDVMYLKAQQGDNMIQEESLNADENIKIRYSDSMTEYSAIPINSVMTNNLILDEDVKVNIKDTMNAFEDKPVQSVQEIEIFINAKEELQ